MNKREAENYRRLINTLDALGFTGDECAALIKIERTLHNWCEKECGDDNGCIERDEKTGKAKYRNSTSGKAWPIADRERGALKRLAAIMAGHAKRNCHIFKDDGRVSAAGPLSYYYQTDCRGCALYIIRPGDVPAGSSVESCYNRGIAICY
jgi:hypothetical protein